MYPVYVSSQYCFPFGFALIVDLCLPLAGRKPVHVSLGTELRVLKPHQLAPMRERKSRTGIVLYPWELELGSY